MAALPLADFAPYPTDIRVAAARSSDAGIEINWSDGAVSRFHDLWLRDNCHCPDCKHPQTHERTFDLLSVPEDLRAERVEATAAGALRIVWPDGGHESLYHPGWLRAHDYSTAPGGPRRPAPRLWRAELGEARPTVEHDRVMADDRALLDWLYLLRDYGFAVMRGVPAEPGRVARIAERIAFARETNFGRIFDVVSMAEPNSNAYTALALPVHVDLPTREYQPGFQFLHCLVSEAEGGGSVLVDGFAVADRLRREDAGAFSLLAGEAVPLRFQDRDVDYRVRRPLIQLTADGGLHEIRVSPFLLDALDLAADKMPAYYRAYRKLTALCRAPDMLMRFRLAPGEMMAFDNRRVLHGRDAFEVGSGDRRLQGCYVDHDEVMSRIRVLERGIPAAAAASAA